MSSHKSVYVSAMTARVSVLNVSEDGAYNVWFYFIVFIEVPVLEFVWERFLGARTNWKSYELYHMLCCKNLKDN